jgi:hypothetical protein
VNSLSFSKPRIIVTGYVGCVPVGGVAWDYLQYAIGLARLGYDVYYHEDTLKWPYHPIQKTQIEDGTYSAQYIENFFKRYAPELSDRWHYFHLRQESFGMTKAKFDDVARTADLFLNISGSVAIPDELSPNCRRIFIDTDPGYNQIKMAQKKESISKVPGFLRVHEKYFTYAENIHAEDCLVPKLEVKWRTTRMPVVLDLWEPLSQTIPATGAPWTTIMTWDEFREKPVYLGVQYQGKGVEFEKIISLPQQVDPILTMAVGGRDAPVERLHNYGWNVLDGPEVTQTPESYQQFVSNARGEISVAKNVYVALRTGWFSCRSACYLAAGRPVVLQNTGFDRVLPTGAGIKVFTDLNEAALAIRQIEASYEDHAKAAREIATEFFDSHKILHRLVQESLDSP